MKFEIENILMIDSGVVFARQVSAGEFALGPRSKLGGVPIQPHVTSPRALRPDGSPRTDLFAFALQSSADLSRFAVGQCVELE